MRAEIADIKKTDVSPSTFPARTLHECPRAVSPDQATLLDVLALKPAQRRFSRFWRLDMEGYGLGIEADGFA